MFTRHRRPGDLVFSLLLVGASGVMAVLLPWQISWGNRPFDPAHPGFWPTLSLAAMIVCAALHAVSSWVSPRIDGRWREVGTWVRSLEYALWFLGYVLAVPILGFLPSSIIFAAALTMRSGYRGQTVLAACLFAVAVVVIFKAGLSVRIPGGASYEHLSDRWQPFFETYL